MKTRLSHIWTRSHVDDIPDISSAYQIVLHVAGYECIPITDPIIIVGFAGLSHKRNLPKEYAAKIIEILATSDEEIASRYRVLENTYNKESKLVSGYNYFLSVLGNASGEYKIGVDILRKILGLSCMSRIFGKRDRISSIIEKPLLSRR
ncbi:MAG: hypothetical protein WAL66_04570, partial [Nitrososphaeraceae archaeon]